MLAQTTTCGYTGSLSILHGGQRPCQSGAFFMPAMGNYLSLVGVETRHTIPERGNRDAATMKAESAPDRPHKGDLSQFSWRPVMANQSIATSVAAPFNFESNTIRAINRDGDIWFVAADVGAVLELTNVRASVALLDVCQCAGVSCATQKGSKK